MDRNWLIRTSQNQILGPVTKAKLLEFVQKGALGLMDEVASGNGYWFSLKEKELVEKYLYGDIPQGYNPISESKSVLARRDNPDKTSSINTAPVNNNQTQVIKLSDLKEGITPKNDDLEFPDLTLVKALPKEETKLPEASDLEFPDVSLISANVKKEFKMEAIKDDSASPALQAEKPARPTKQEPINSHEEIVLPDEDDLAFPDLSLTDKTSTKVEKGKVDLSKQYTRTVALDSDQSEKVFEKADEVTEEELDMTVVIPPEWQVKESDLIVPPPSDEDMVKEKEPSLKLFDRAVKKPDAQKRQLVQTNDDKKLLHERKAKGSKPSSMRDPTRETAHVSDVESGPLKKRNDNYIFFILIILILIIVAVFFYFKEILNKPLPV